MGRLVATEVRLVVDVGEGGGDEDVPLSILGESVRSVQLQAVEKKRQSHILPSECSVRKLTSSDPARILRFPTSAAGIGNGEAISRFVGREEKGELSRAPVFDA